MRTPNLLAIAAALAATYPNEPPIERKPEPKPLRPPPGTLTTMPGRFRAMHYEVKKAKQNEAPTSKAAERRRKQMAKMGLPVEVPILGHAGTAIMDDPFALQPRVTPPTGYTFPDALAAPTFPRQFAAPIVMDEKSQIPVKAWDAVDAAASLRAAAVMTTALMKRGVAVTSHKVDEITDAILEEEVEQAAMYATGADITGSGTVAEEAGQSVGFDANGSPV